MTQFIDQCVINDHPPVPARVEREADYETIEGGFMPDPDWEHVDAAGHYHAVADGRTPTLEVRETERSWCELCGDVHGDRYDACKICGERIDVPAVPAPPRQFEASSRWLIWVDDLPYGIPDGEEVTFRMMLVKGFGYATVRQTSANVEGGRVRITAVLHVDGEIHRRKP